MPDTVTAGPVPASRPVGGPSPILRILVAARLLGPLGMLLLALVMGAGITLALFLGVGVERDLVTLSWLMALLAMFALAVGLRRLYTQLLRPLVRLEHSVADVCQGEPSARLPLENMGVLGAVIRDIGSISEELAEVYEDMDNRVSRQTRRLAQQTASLRILYDVAASINHADNLDALLLQFLRALKELLSARSATVCLVKPEGGLHMVGAIDESGRLLTGPNELPLQLCGCGAREAACCDSAPAGCTRGKWTSPGSPWEVVEVPLEYHGDRMGLYTVYVDQPGIAGREDFRDLLETIGHHLGMAVAKQRSDEHARRLSIIEERTSMAHELHDSLAQTLAGLRFQMSMVEDVLDETASPRLRSDVRRVRNGLDEAHTEIRELINSFLYPTEQGGLEQALEKLTQRFRQETGVHIFFHRDCSHMQLSSSEELQILRIVQECLANIRKHAQAHTVRVLFNCRDDGAVRLLVEDDGVGFDETVPEGSPGEHIGLSIMEERARRLGGELRIESEPGEGTRVELTYNPGTKGQRPRWGGQTAAACRPEPNAK